MAHPPDPKYLTYPPGITAAFAAGSDAIYVMHTDGVVRRYGVRLSSTRRWARESTYA